MPQTDQFDPDGIDIAAQFIEEMGCSIAFGGWVKKVNKKKGYSKRILFVTEAFITYVKDSKSPSLSHNCSWSTLLKIDKIDNRIELTFKNLDKLFQFSFISNESDIIFRKIFDVLLHEMTPNELAPLDLGRFRYPRISINPRGVLGRFDQHLIRFGLNPHEVKFREIFKSYLQSLKPNFFLEPFEHLFPVIKQVLYALVGSPNTKAFFFPEIKEKVQVYSLYRFIAYFAKLPASVRYIQFQSPIISKINAIISAFSNKTESKINGIGYSNIDMSEKQIEKMKSLITTKPFVSLRWCNINPPNSIEQIYRDQNVQECLMYLALDDSENLNFARLAPFLSNLSILSLERCDLEIADVFEIIDQNNLSSLRMLNLSFNAARRPIEPTTNIPSTLQRIDISHVRFSNNVMANVIEVLITNKYDKGIKFYCDRYYIADEKEEQATLNNFENIETSYLIEFSWRKNKVSRSLIDFLSRSPNLIKVIFEANIYNNDDDNLIDELVSIFPKLRYLTHLYIVGGKKEKLGTNFNDDFLSGLEELPNLTYLDLSNNGISDDGIEKISQMLRDLPTLTHISLDNNNITSLEPIKRMCYAAMDVHRKFYISYPEEEIKTLLESQRITEDDIDELIELLKNASSTNKGSPIRRTRRRNTTNIDQDPSTNSTDFPRSSFSFKKKRRLTESLYVNEGHAKNIKKNPLSEYEYQQDPDSIFIQPFDRYTGSINDNAFPLYFTEELEKELSSEREFAKPVLKVTPYKSYDLFKFNEMPRLKLSISPTSSISSNDIFNPFDLEDDFPMSPLTRDIPKVFDNTPENKNQTEQEKEIIQNEEKIEEEEELEEKENKNEEESKSEEESKLEIKKQEEESKSEEEIKPEVEKQEEESKHEEESKSEVEKHEEESKPEIEKHEEESKSEEEIKPEIEKHEEEDKNEQIQEVHTRTVEMNTDDSPKINDSEYYTEPEIESEDIIEAVTFHPPSWYFPIPRATRPSNKRFIKEMSYLLSAKKVINDLKKESEKTNK